jgi:hypothetical protein
LAGITGFEAVWSNTNETNHAAMNIAPNIHLGEVLIEEFLLPLNISQNALALAANVPPRRIKEIVLGKQEHQGRYRRASGRRIGDQRAFLVGTAGRLRSGRGAPHAGRCGQQHRAYRGVTMFLPQKSKKGVRYIFP